MPGRTFPGSWIDPMHGVVRVSIDAMMLAAIGQYRLQLCSREIGFIKVTQSECRGFLPVCCRNQFAFGI